MHEPRPALCSRAMPFEDLIPLLIGLLALSVGMALVLGGKG